MQRRKIVTRIAVTAMVGICSQAEGQAPDTGRTTGEDRAVASATAQSAATTRYTLVEVSGKPLPALVEKELRCREEVTAGALMLRADGRWLLETTSRETCGERVKDDRDSDDGTYRVERKTIRFFDDDGRENSDRGWGVGRDIDIDELKTGTTADDETLKVQLADGRTTLVFRR